MDKFKTTFIIYAYKINSYKTSKLLYICATIYNFFYLIKNNKTDCNILLFCFICIQLNFKKLQTSARTDATPDARLFSNLGKVFKKRCFFNTVKKSL